MLKTLGILFFAVTALADLPSIEKYSWGPKDAFKPGFRAAPWIRDPFYPSKAKFSLQGIISSELAFVNNRWVREGDKIDGYTVTQVNEKSVALRKAAEEVILYLQGQGNEINETVEDK